MAFNFLQSLIRPSCSTDISSSVDDFEGDLDESDVELDGDEDAVDRSSIHSEIDSDNELDMESESRSSESSRSGDEADNAVSDLFSWSDELNPVEIDMFLSGVGPKLENMNIDDDSTPLDFFHLFFPEELIDTIAEQTNLYAQQQNNATFTPVTVNDIKTFLYINMMFGIHQLPAYTFYWSLDPLLRVGCVADVMSRNRYQEISRFLHLNDNRNFIPKGQDGYDPLFKIRPAITAIQKACTSLFNPGVALSFDEAMIPFRGRLSFKQYIKGKPHPWGVKVWCVCDSATSFLLDFDFYTGKSDPTNMPNGLGYHVIWKLGQPFLRKKHHFYFDNFFSSVKLASDLLENETYSCATVRANRKHWPKEFRGKLSKGDCRMKQIGNLVATWWSDKRVISMLSTNASPVLDTASRCTKEGPVDKQIPQSVLVYNANMGGVDKADQMRAYYPVGRKSKKWWRCCLWFLFEVSALNAYILYKSMPRLPSSRPLTHLQFHLEIARGLMKGSSRKRAQREAPTAAGLATPRASEEH